MRYYLLVWEPRQGDWVEADHVDLRRHSRRAFSKAEAILHNRHPRLKGLWAIVAEYDLDEALHRNPYPQTRALLA